MIKGLLLLGGMTLALLSPKQSYAIEYLNFKKELSPTTEVLLGDFLDNAYNTNTSLYEIARVDLNNDGIDEYVLKRLYCSQEKTLCTHLILAESKDSIVSLLNIRAKTIAIAETRTYNIRDILVFDDSLNDYTSVIYMWSPSKKMYILKTIK